MLQSKKYDAAFCGGGIGGLTAALTLGARGLSSIVVERMSTASSHGSGLQLGPNACHVLSDLGLLSDLLSFCTQPKSIFVGNLTDTSKIVNIPLGKVSYKKYHAPYLLVHRSDLHFLLTKKAIESPYVDFASDFFAEKFIDHGDEIELLSARQKSFRASALIGSDGLWSVIRKQLHGNILPRNSGQIAWRALVPKSKISTKWQNPQSGLWLGENKHMVTYPVKGGEYLNVVIITKGKAPGHGWSETGNKSELLLALDDADASLKEVIEAAPEFNIWQLFDRDPLDIWGRNRVSLLGDAAHPMLPHLAQGAGMAIEDSYVLAHCLDKYRNDFGAGLRKYEVLRQKRTAKVQMASREQSKNYHMASVKGKMRNLALSFADKFMPTKLLDQYDWLYGVNLQDMITGSTE